jgi:hypothetical protein
MTGITRRTLRTALAAASVLALGACANMADTPPGTPIAQVEAKFGAPNFSCPLPYGGKRLIWSQQPAGQYAWGTNVDAAGNTDRVVPLLTDAHFQVLAKGTWTPEQVRCEFGPPAIKDTVGLPSDTQIVWSYRYKQDQVWNSFMYVYFGRDGSHVTRFHPGPDLSYEDHLPFF